MYVALRACSCATRMDGWQPGSLAKSSSRREVPLDGAASPSGGCISIVTAKTW